MVTYILRLPAHEVVRLLRAETLSSRGEPELNTGASEEYVIEEEFDRGAYGFDNGANFDLVTSIATLTIEPRVEQGYWVLETVVERDLGPVPTSQEYAFAYKELTLDDFENELDRPGVKHTSVRLHVETSAIRADFNRWLAEMQARHASETEAVALNAAKSPMPQEKASAKIRSAKKKWYLVREAVGIFNDPDAFETAIGELESSGFDRAAISVLAMRPRAKEHIDRFYKTVEEWEESDEASRGTFISSHSRAEAEGAVIAFPLYIGGVAGALAVTAAGGALAGAIAVTIASGAVGASLGALLAATIKQQHRARVKELLQRGGLVLWVRTPNSDAERRAASILSKRGAIDVHVHEVKQEWGLNNVPLANIQFDPFLLERDP